MSAFRRPRRLDLRFDETVEVLRPVFVDKARQLAERDRFLDLGLGLDHGIVHQGGRLRARRLIDYVLALNKITESLQ